MAVLTAAIVLVGCDSFPGAVDLDGLNGTLIIRNSSQSTLERVTAWKRSEYSCGAEDRIVRGTMPPGSEWSQDFEPGCRYEIRFDVQMGSDVGGFSETVTFAADSTHLIAVKSCRMWPLDVYNRCP